MVYHRHSFIHSLSIWIVLYGMSGIMESAYILSGSGQSAVSILFWGVAIFSQCNCWGAYNSAASHSALYFLSHSPSWPVFLTLEELETLWFGMNPMVHRWSLMCTNHIDMTAHTPAFLPSQVPLIYMCSAAQLGIVTYHTLWRNASRTVTHSCINWAHDYLTSVIKQKIFAPCYWLPHRHVCVVNGVN